MCVCADRLAVLERDEHDAVAGLRQRRAIPRAVEREERSAGISRRRIAFFAGTNASDIGAQCPGNAITGCVFAAQSPCLMPSPPYSGACTFFFAIGS